jgi:N-acetylglucosaminyl-diphospho-decaprenol L-rhamnosyltransferase
MTALLTVIVTHNSARDIGRCVSSVLAQAHDYGSHTVAVIDNASIDGTPASLVRLSYYPSVEVAFNRENVGFGRAVNQATRAFAASDSDVLLFNPDCVMPPGAIKELSRLLKLPNAGVATLTLLMSNGNPDPACARSAPDLRSAVRHARQRTRQTQTQGYNVEPAGAGQVKTLEATTGALMLLSSECRERVGPLDERFWMYGEDLDLCRRVHNAGYVIYQSGTPSVLHTKGASSGKFRRVRVNYAFHAAMWLYYRKHLARCDPVVIQAAVLIGIVGRGGASVLQSAVGRALQTFCQG